MTPVLPVSPPCPLHPLPGHPRDHRRVCGARAGLPHAVRRSHAGGRQAAGAGGGGGGGGGCGMLCCTVLCGVPADRCPRVAIAKTDGVAPLSLPLCPHPPTHNHRHHHRHSHRHTHTHTHTNTAVPHCCPSARSLTILRTLTASATPGRCWPGARRRGPHPCACVRCRPPHPLCHAIVALHCLLPVRCQHTCPLLAERPSSRTAARPLHPLDASPALQAAECAARQPRHGHCRRCRAQGMAARGRQGRRAGRGKGSGAGPWRQGGAGRWWQEAGGQCADPASHLPACLVFPVCPPCRAEGGWLPHAPGLPGAVHEAAAGEGTRVWGRRWWVWMVETQELRSLLQAGWQPSPPIAAQPCLPHWSTILHVPPAVHRSRVPPRPGHLQRPRRTGGTHPVSCSTASTAAYACACFALGR